MILLASQCRSDRYLRPVLATEYQAQARPVSHQNRLDSYAPGYLRFRVEGVTGVGISDYFDADWLIVPWAVPVNVV